MMQHQICFSGNAATEMVMASIESYVIGVDLGRVKGPVETLAHLWGYRRYRNNIVVHMIDHASVSTSTIRKPTSVRYHDDVLKYKHAIANFMRPTYTFLGDFHTHPNRNRSENERNQGWGYSDTDRDSLIGGADLWNYSDHCPIMMIMAVSNVDRVAASEQQIVRSNVLRFNIGEYRFWLAAYVGVSNDVDGRILAADDDVIIDRFPCEIWQGSSERLLHYI